MEIKQLLLEIGEAERLIERNRMIISLNDQLRTAQQQLKAQEQPDATTHTAD